MPWPGLQATCTVPVAGSGKLKTQRIGSRITIPVAGFPLMRRSDASRLVTGLEKCVSICGSERSVNPGRGADGGRDSILQIVLPGRTRGRGIKSILRKSKVENAVGSAPGNLDRTERRLHES